MSFFEEPALHDITAIVPFKNHADMTLQCVKSLIPLGLGRILLVDNRSAVREADIVRTVAAEYNNIDYISYDCPFNFQALNNWAVQQTDTATLWFVNNDVVVPKTSETLVAQMRELVNDPNTGAVGCVLLYGDERVIQHAGVYLVPGGFADHLYAGKRLQHALTDSTRYPYRIDTDLEVVAVTAASLMMSREHFNAVGGFNEAFTIGGGDVDLCLRLRNLGLHNYLVGANYGVMIHHESKSRSGLGIPYGDFSASYRSYITQFDLVRGDPFIDVRKLGKA
ncbi:MAG: glycosyltransferase [Propionibacteriaceae bacterium]|nr:glycosyltransferase [Propionibacteriaceae bacterium]